jgi:hypothetical protein
MVHQFLHDLLKAVGVSGLVAGAVIWLFWIAGWVERVWRRPRRRSRLDYERYQAEQAIRSIKRRAVHELLTAEREYRDRSGNGEIIEGTAVEVRRA